MGVRVGGSVAGVGGSVGSGGTYVRLGPLSVGGRLLPRGASRQATPLLAIALAMIIIAILMPLALAAFWLWQRHQWIAIGRPRLRQVHPRDRAFLIASRVALPVAVAWAAVVWGWLYADAVHLEPLPYVSRVSVAEARADLDDAGFTAEFTHAGGLAPLSDDCEVRDTRHVTFERGRLVDRRSPVPLDAYCRLSVTRRTLGEAREVITPTGMAVTTKITSGDGLLSDDCDVLRATSQLSQDARSGTVILEVRCRSPR